MGTRCVPTTKGKETFQYNNQLLTAAGHIAAHTIYPKKKMDEAFCDLMSEKLFKPMGMNNTGFAAQDNYAYPHSLTLDGETQALPQRVDDFTLYQKPAGGVWSSAHDMALYILTELKGGINAEGTRVFDEHNLMYRRTPQAKSGHDNHYGLGWGIAKYKELISIGHGGSTMGFKSALRFFPEKQCGYVLLCNGDNGYALNNVIEMKLHELWFGVDEKSSDLVEFHLKEIKKRVKELNDELSEPNPNFMNPFLRKYANEDLGTFEIKKDEDTYTLDINGLYKTKLMARAEKNGDKTLAMIAPPYVGMTLIPIEGGSFKMMEGQHDYVFNKAEK